MPPPKNAVALADRDRVLARAKRAIPERDVQAAILAYLRARRILVFRSPVGAALIDGRVVRWGYLGQPDLSGSVWVRCGCGARHARPFAIEVKRAGQRPRPHQRVALEALRRAGWIAFSASSAAEVERQLKVGTGRHHGMGTA